MAKAGYLWIAWIEAYKLKGRSVWQVLNAQNCSWNWRKILQLRPLAYRFVEWKDEREEWKYKGQKYSVGDVWEEIRHKQDRTVWHRLIWTSLSIPKHAIVSWITILNRLPTMD